MKNIIVISYQLNPYKGSECSVAWDYVVNMSKKNRLTVLFGSSEEYHMIGNTKSMMDYIERNPIENVTLMPIPLDESFDVKDYSALGIYQFYKQYKKWHQKVKFIVSGLISKGSYDLIHYLGPIGYREPGYLYDLGLPYIWGPIGGFGGINFKLLKATCSISGAATLSLRKLVNLYQQHYNKRVRDAVNHADIVLGATTEYANIIRKYVKKESRVEVKYLPENCMKEVHPLNKNKFDNKGLRLIWIGRPDANKGLILLLEALAKLSQKEMVQLDLVGSGVLENKLKKWSKEHGLEDSVRWNGRVERERVFTMLNEAHLNVITSLYDANTTVIWEAMAMGVPTMSLDHCGMHDTITSETGIKIPIHSYEQVVDGIKENLQQLIDNPKKKLQMAEALVDYRKQFTWEQRSQFFEEMYNLAINNRNGKK